MRKLEVAKSINTSRRYKCKYAVCDAMLGGHSVRLFFCRRGKSDKWKVLLTTDTKVDFMRAYEIYAMRWSIDVFFSDAKRVLGLTDSPPEISPRKSRTSLSQ